jgi:hypothetical protein
MDSLVVFLRGWGALLLGAIGTILGVRSELRSRKEHRWKAEDRHRLEAERALEAERLAWCRAMQLALEARPDEPVHIGADKLEWARWGDGQHFRLNAKMSNMILLVRLS